MNGTLIMKGKAWLFGYGLTLLLHLAAITAGWSMVRFVTKPMLMVLLLVFFLAAGPKTGAPRFLITLALFFSWLGDVFLMNEGTRYFTAGLASFLVAHLFYILYFSGLRRKQSPRKTWNIILLVILGLYVGIFYFFLGPALEQPLKIPVFLYAIVIATMFAMAWHSTGSSAQTASQAATTSNATWFITGAALFIISDSLLAVNAFLHPFNSASFWVMITYGLAQAAIVFGTVRRAAQATTTATAGTAGEATGEIRQLTN